MKVALVLGPDEAANGPVAVKNLVNGEQVIVSQDAATEYVEKILR